MNQTWERVWVSWLNSDRWRQFAKYGPGARFFRSPTYRRLDNARRYAISYVKSRQYPALFSEVETFCMFVGHVKSGSTLIGSMLDAHPDVILADEADVLRYLDAGFSRDQIFHILLKGSRREAMKGRITARRLTPYSCAVPGQWQGRYRHLRVIGDSKAGPTTKKLGRRPAQLDQLQQTMNGLNLRIIQVIRNPFDPISAMMIRGGRSFADAIAHYFDYCQTLSVLRSSLTSETLLPIRYEELVLDPQSTLTALCQYLQLNVDQHHLHACAAILDPQPQQLRRLVTWTPHWITAVHDRIDGFDFLEGYRYDH